MKNMEPSSSLKIMYPASFHFKEERVLVVHPPSCHPQRVFGCPENGKKMRESEAEEKEAGELKASHQKETFIKEGDDLTVSSLGAFIAKPLYKITKIT